jgi:hypothetical protein
MPTMPERLRRGLAKAWLRGQAIIPHQPLKAGAAYRATVRGKVDGRPFEYTWSFTTA